MSNPWKIDEKKLTITFDCKKFKHIFYASDENDQEYLAKIKALNSPIITQTIVPKLKLHLGCGQEHLDGYINIDAESGSAIDMVSDCTELSAFKNDSVDEIVSYHMIEHLPAKKLQTTLTEWNRVLKKEGKLVIECPDLELVCKAFVEASDQERYISWNQGPALIYHIYGNQGDEFEFHKFGFSKSFLEYVLKSYGFQNVYYGQSHKDYRVPCIHIEAIKK